MKFARVIGTVVASHKYDGLDGIKLLIVQPLDKSLSDSGQPQVAADATAQAGPGSLVFVVGSLIQLKTFEVTLVDHLQ